MKTTLNRFNKILFCITKPEIEQVPFKAFKSGKKNLFLLAIVSLCFTGCNISNSDLTPGPEEITESLSLDITMFAEVNPFYICPDETGVVVPMFHPHVFNVQLREADEFLLPYVHAVSGHFQMKLCKTNTENFQADWNLRINNKESLGFTGWSLLNQETEEELFGVQFSNKVESGKKVQNNGIMEVDGAFLETPQDHIIVIRTTNTEVNLVGLLLPAVLAGK